jgi:hypothetical protein
MANKAWAPPLQLVMLAPLFAYPFICKPPFPCPTYKDFPARLCWCRDGGHAVTRSLILPPWRKGDVSVESESSSWVCSEASFSLLILPNSKVQFLSSGSQGGLPSLFSDTGALFLYDITSSHHFLPSVYLKSIGTQTGDPVSASRSTFVPPNG